MHTRAAAAIPPRQDPLTQAPEVGAHYCHWCSRPTLSFAQSGRKCRAFTSHRSATVPCDASNSLISVPLLVLPIRFEVMKPGERCTYGPRTPFKLPSGHASVKAGGRSRRNLCDLIREHVSVVIMAGHCTQTSAVRPDHYLPQAPSDRPHPSARSEQYPDNGPTSQDSLR